MINRPQRYKNTEFAEFARKTQSFKCFLRALSVISAFSAFYAHLPRAAFLTQRRRGRRVSLALSGRKESRLELAERKP